MVRLPLACLVDGHAGFEVAPFLLAMAREPLTPPERALLVQIAGTVRDERFTAWLTTELANPHRMTRLAATRSLGHPWHAPAVPALAPLTSASDLGLARAALDSLAAIGTPEARNVLRNAIASTADLKRRTWAEAALRRTQPDTEPGTEPDQEVAPGSATPSATRSVLLEF
jgi:hypothetical protein